MSTNQFGVPEPAIPGVLPDFGQFGLPEDLVAEDLEILEEQEEVVVPQPLGHDMAFDLLTGEFSLKSGVPGHYEIWVRQATEAQALAQWVTIALTTVRGAHLIYPDNFGSDIRTLISGNMPRTGILAELPQMIEEAVLFHDRIESIQNLSLDPSQGEALHVSFDVVLDDDARLSFSGSLPL